MVNVTYEICLAHFYRAILPALNDGLHISYFIIFTTMMWEVVTWRLANCKLKGWIDFLKPDIHYESKFKSLSRDCILLSSTLTDNPKIVLWSLLSMPLTDKDGFPMPSELWTENERGKFSYWLVFPYRLWLRFLCFYIFGQHISQVEIREMNTVENSQTIQWVGYQDSRSLLHIL